ncbi:Ig-like domain-containing protein, partial [Flavobacterium sp.]|uniref:Ig-like domain-containing protein n=1 Tax=Flavobacterium sp. TaxID=239 RepID=UPI0037C16C66
MQNFTSIKASGKRLLLILFFALMSLNMFAEGTPTVSPNPTNITALLSAPDLLSGPYFNAPEDNRVKFTITNNATQNLYFGFDFRQYAAGSPVRLNNVYWRIRRSSDLAVVAGPTLWDSAAGTVGSIDTHAQALAGPNIEGSLPTGYLPIIFDPTQDGEYFIEIYRSNDLGVTARTGAADRANAALFDLTVANNFAPYTRFNGRVNSDKWGFVALSSTYGNSVTANAEPVLFGYTNDQTIVRLDFETGFQPIAFNVALNSYGVTNIGSWLSTRRSRGDLTSPPLTNGYRVFLNSPDATLYPVGPIPANPTFLNPSVTGCGPFTIRYNVSEPGDVRLLLNLNGVPGYQPASADRVLEAIDVLAGNNTIAWDGLDGLGASVPSGTNVNLALTFLKGRFNLPLFDAEMNANGIRISIVAPVAIANTQMYWDDSQLTASVGTCDATPAAGALNFTGPGINNSIAGTLAPAHAWSGDGNPTQVLPAPIVASNDTDGFQCSDFGNSRTINTWGWGYTSSATNLDIVLGCADVSIVKTVSNPSPTIGTNVTFTLTASNAGPAPSDPTTVNDILPSGYTYQSDNSGGNYDAVSGVWNVGPLASGGNAAIQIVATVNPTGLYTNTATISGSQEDATPANNTDSVTPVPNNPPVADNESVNTPYDTNVNILASTGDTDIDGTINPASIDLDPTTPLTNETTFTVAGEGTYTANADGTVTFDPLPTFSGTTTPVNYTIEDNNGANSNIATLTVTVANNPPVADNESVNTPYDTNVNILASTGDTDIDGTINPASIDL